MCLLFTGRLYRYLFSKLVSGRVKRRNPRRVAVYMRHASLILYFLTEKTIDLRQPSVASSTASASAAAVAVVVVYFYIFVQCAPFEKSEHHIRES